MPEPDPTDRVTDRLVIMPLAGEEDEEEEDGETSAVGAIAGGVVAGENAFVKYCNSLCKSRNFH